MPVKRLPEPKSKNSKLFDEKITFEELKKHLWAAADILRGSVEPSVYRQPVMTLLFLKRLNDTFEENAEKLEQGERVGKKRGRTLGGTASMFPPMRGGQSWPVLPKTLAKR